jgi:hypothetical protein
MHIANRHEALVMSADHTTLRSQASTAAMERQPKLS